MIVQDPKIHAYTSSMINGIVHGFGTKKLQDFPNPIDHKHFVYMKQSHGTHITHIDSVSDNTDVTVIENCDGLSTFLPKTLLTVKTGDCIPVLYFDPVTQIIAISHQGWKGVLANMSLVMISHLRKKGVDEKNLKIVMGPSIGPCCNRFSEPEVQLFREAYPRWADTVIQPYDDGDHMDLRTLTYLQFKELGISDDHFESWVCCTKCQGDIFWSHRARTYEFGNINKVGWNFIMKKS